MILLNWRAREAAQDPPTFVPAWPVRDTQRPSPFKTVTAVDTWDAHFRWREEGRLRDHSIEATWQRTAEALAMPDGADAARSARRFFEAQTQWQLLLDPAILASIGTHSPRWPAVPAAVLNVAAFLRGVPRATAYFDRDAFANAAQVAVHALDNALLIGGHRGIPRRIGIGVIGFADAIDALGKRYDAPGGRVFAADLAKELAENALLASTELAAGRGGSAPNDRDLACARERGFSQGTVARLQRCGVRHVSLTRIDTQPVLAALANGVSDALDPLPARDSMHGERIEDPAGVDAQIALRGAMQPFIDMPIDYPLRIARALDERGHRERWQNLASVYGLGALRWETHPPQ